MNKVKKLHPVLDVKVHNRGGYYFTHGDMVTRHQDNWNAILQDLKGKEINILEIGSLQGSSATFWLDNLLSHPNSTLWCVEPFNRTKTVPDMALFLFNIAQTGKSDKVNAIFKTSDEFFKNLPADLPEMDLVYVDGSHEEEVVRRDCKSCFSVCKTGGIMILDDYKMPRVFADDKKGPKQAIDEFLASHQHKLEIINLGYQVAIRKLKN